MKKVLILFLFFIELFANENEILNYKKCEKYINEILNYKVKLEPISYNPFYVSIQKKRKDQKKNKKQKINSSIKILVILNNKAYLLLREGKKTKKAWIKVGEKLGDYKLIKILKEALLFKHKNKFEVVKLNKKMERFTLKVSQ